MKSCLYTWIYENKAPEILLYVSFPCEILFIYLFIYFILFYFILFHYYYFFFAFLF